MIRFERKYLSKESQNTKIENFLKCSNKKFIKHFEDRSINNIYYDSSNFDLYWDSEDGNSKRFKIRIRWYGDYYKDLINPQLEIKKKEGFCNEKITFKLGELNSKIFFKDPSKIIFDKLKKELISDEKKIIFKHILEYTPKLINSYKRKYFISNDKKIRVTIDTDLKFNFFKNNLAPLYLTDKLLITEIKYNSDSYLVAEDFIEKFPLRLNKISKYVYGLKILSQL